MIDDRTQDGWGNLNTNTVSADLAIERETGVRFERSDEHTVILLSGDGHEIARRTVRASRSQRRTATRADIRWALAHHAEYSVALVRVDGIDRATGSPMSADVRVIDRARGILRAIERADGVG